jgi:hypothetical protein
LRALLDRLAQRHAVGRGRLRAHSGRYSYSGAMTPRNPRKR